MNILNATKELMINFAREEDGAQVVEYALVIALVSIALAIALGTAFATSPFGTFVARVATCLGVTPAAGQPPSC
jgi:pilus assembly protein Flp/PilA